MAKPTDHDLTLVEELYVDVCRLQRKLMGTMGAAQMAERVNTLEEATEHLAQAPAGTVRDILFKLEIFCARLHRGLQLTYREDALTYILAESCRQDMRLLPMSRRVRRKGIG